MRELSSANPSGPQGTLWGSWVMKRRLETVLSLNHKPGRPFAGRGILGAQLTRDKVSLLEEVSLIQRAAWWGPRGRKHPL